MYYSGGRGASLMVWDCFAFFNELDLLRLRLETLDPIVDRFVLVEATKTFQKTEKPLYFNENKELFAKYLPKIEHVIVDKYPNFFSKFRTPKPWDYDNHQKEFIKIGLKKAVSGDKIIISDLDEIPKPELISQNLNHSGITVFRQRLYYYYLNYLCTYLSDAKADGGAQENKDGLGWWKGSVMMPYEVFKGLGTVKKARQQRDKKEPFVKVAHDAGWHFAYLGGVEKIIAKLEAYAHVEHNVQEYKSPERIINCIKEGKSIHNESRFMPVEMDETFPIPLQASKEQYSHLIFSNY